LKENNKSKKVLQRFGGSFAKQKRGTPLFLLFLLFLALFGKISEQQLLKAIQ